MAVTAVADSAEKEDTGLAEREARAALLEAEMAEVCGVANAAAGRQVELIAEVLATGAWTGVGIRSPEHWVAWRCGVGPGRARSLVNLARREAELPATVADLRTGALSEDQAAAVARFVPAESEAEAAELAQQATVSQLRRTLSAYPFPHPDDITDEAKAPSPPPEETRRVNFGTTGAGTWRCSAELPLDEGALVERALQLHRDRLFRDAVGGNDRGGNNDVSWADALVSMAQGSLASADIERPGGTRTLVWFHLDTDRYGKAYGHPHGGPTLPEALRRLITCDARVRPVWETDGRPVSVGRSMRTVPDRIRMAVEERDRVCRVPGCDRTRGLEIHHIVHWEDGGPTDMSNLAGICSPDHRRHHRGELGISGNANEPDGLVFTDARGRRLTGSGRPAPPGDPPLVAARRHGLDGTWLHPSGEHLDTRWVEFRAG